MSSSSLDTVYWILKAFKSDKSNHMAGISDVAAEHREQVTKIRLLNQAIETHPFLPESHRRRYKELILEIAVSDPSIAEGYSAEYLKQKPSDADVQKHIWE